MLWAITFPTPAFVKTAPRAARSWGKRAVAPICINNLEVSSDVSLNLGFIISEATRSAINAPPPIPTADGIVTFPILNCNIRKAEIPINAAGINILFLNFSLWATLNSCVTSLNVPICNWFVTVINPKITSIPPVTA